MKSLIQLFHPLQRAADAFFKHDVALRRGDRGLHLVLEKRGAKHSDKPSREELAKSKEDAELALIGSQLADLLAGLPETRNTMRHLVFVEQALAKKGLRALRKLPLNVLQHALAQLEGLVTNWSPEGLANLRSKMAVAILDREHADPDAEADAYRTAAVLDTAIHEPALPEVSEAGTDDGEALAAAYAALGDLAPLAPAAIGAEGLEMSTELSSPSAKAVLRDFAARSDMKSGSIQLRELQG